MYQAVLGTVTATNRHNLKSHGHRPRGNGKLDRTERIVHEVKPLPRAHLDTRIQRGLGVLRDVHPAAGAGDI